MSWFDNHRNGAKAEAVATAWLIGQGFRVYRCVSGPGPADLVVGDDDGGLRMVDVKRRGFRPGATKTLVARANVSQRQRELGVEFLYVLHDGSVCWESEL